MLQRGPHEDNYLVQFTHKYSFAIKTMLEILLPTGEAGLKNHGNVSSIHYTVLRP